jgi:hypothetical protein
MSVLTELQTTVATQRRLVTALEPGCLSGPDALALLAILTEGERVLAAGRTLVAKRVEESNVWRASGDRSAAHFIALKTGTTVGRTQAALETAQRLESLPATAEAFRTGRLSETQTEAVASAAAANPNEERRLLEKAASDSVKQLRDECLRVKHAATDEQARYDAIRRDRNVRTWVDGEGGFNGAFRTTVDSGAAILAALETETERIFSTARKEGRREPRAAYAMDALEALVCGGTSEVNPKQPKTIFAFADYTALVRGESTEGEAVEIAGLGPVPVSVLESWANDAYLRLIITDGIDIKAVTRQTRYVDANQRAALVARDRDCIIAGCDANRRLQIDHVDPFAAGGPTCVTNTNRMCPFHHLLKTRGWSLVGGPGCYRLVPPARGDPPKLKPRNATSGARRKPRNGARPARE